MIAVISGKVLEKEAQALIINVGGLGYRVRVLTDVWNKVAVGDPISLRTHHHISDDDEVLFGFLEREHLKFFRLLLTVPSVGTKTAMGILEVAPPATLAQAVADGDVALLTKVSGVGKKTAQRILVELKEKIGKDVPRGQATGEIQESAIEALTSIGYGKAEARKAVAALPPDVTTVEEAVRVALREKAHS